MFEVPATRGIIHESARKRGMSHDIADMYWSMFEMTGSVLAYLLYRHYLSSTGEPKAPVITK